MYYWVDFFVFRGGNVIRTIRDYFYILLTVSQNISQNSKREIALEKMF